MKYILILLSCIIIAPISAETVRNIEFNLPEAAQNWEKEGTDPENTIIVYHPKDEQENKEFFGIRIYPVQSDVRDTETMKNSLSKMFPKTDVEMQLVESTDDTVLCEFSVKDLDKETIHGWIRGFSVKDGTVVFLYQTDKVADIAQAKDTWLPVLRDARIN